MQLAEDAQVGNVWSRWSRVASGAADTVPAVTSRANDADPYKCNATAFRATRHTPHQVSMGTARPRSPSCDAVGELLRTGPGQPARFAVSAMPHLARVYFSAATFRALAIDEAAAARAAPARPIRPKPAKSPPPGSDCTIIRVMVPPPSIQCVGTDAGLQRRPRQPPTLTRTSGWLSADEKFGTEVHYAVHPLERGNCFGCGGCRSASDPLDAGVGNPRC